MDTAELLDAMAGLAAVAVGLWALSAAVWVNLLGLSGTHHERHMSQHARHARH